jgi:hypothetical protein
MKHLFTALPLIALPVMAMADAQLDRMEAASEDLTNKMLLLMAQDMGSDGSALPEFAWDEGFRAAGTCMMDAYRDEGGDALIETMLTRLEEFNQREFSGFEEMVNAQAELSLEEVPEARQIEITQACGMAELSMEWMMSSGAMAAMQ